MKPQARLFGRFYRAPGVEQKNGSRVGLKLGLHMCRSSTERHDGRVGVERTMGKYSHVWLTLPTTVAAAEQGA
jgi:signal transduction histidine kinase